MSQAVLTRDDRARLERLISRLSHNRSYDTAAEAELLDWCFREKGVFEALKKRKHDTTISREARSQLQNIVVVTRARKSGELE